GDDLGAEEAGGAGGNSELVAPVVAPDRLLGQYAIGVDPGQVIAGGATDMSCSPARAGNGAAHRMIVDTDRQVRPGGGLGDVAAAGAHGAEDGRLREFLEPQNGGRAGEDEGTFRLQRSGLVIVAAADGGKAQAGGEAGLPALQRDPVPGQPGLLPDLHAVDRRQLVVPGDVGLVVVDREQTAPFVHQPGQRVGVGGAGHAEVDPVVDAEDV